MWWGIGAIVFSVGLGCLMAWGILIDDAEKQRQACEEVERRRSQWEHL